MRRKSRFPSNSQTNKKERKRNSSLQSGDDRIREEEALKVGKMVFLSFLAPLSGHWVSQYEDRRVLLTPGCHVVSTS
ncbi:hypothetical protein CgunFtcFv8_006169 [Champsocephalus gunnari]|uniref:Uncharacterized protein n=1 Tax=Champsocephalus gunnari TaxID=52237 RepID=A0AAN8BWR1_CHAGU|nr:hypothetical protein CgunFtcFv8_006169 [Champsocephalus gunnari]